MTLLQQNQRMTPGVAGECWHLLAVVQNKFATEIDPNEKKTVQIQAFTELKKYVGKDTNLNTIAALLRSLAKSLKENYLNDETIRELYTYVSALIMPLKPTYTVNLAALELLETRLEIFKEYVLGSKPEALFNNLRDYTTHKNRDFSLKSLEVMISLTEMFVKEMLKKPEKHQKLFSFINDKVNNDLSNHSNKNKEEANSEDKKGFSLLTVVRLIGLMAPVYLEYQGIAYYKKIFNYIIKKCTRKIML